MLKIYIYGYLNRIQSSRRLERETQRNVELIWLPGRLSPDFKTIADFRRDNGKAIRRVCREFVVLCRSLNLFSEHGGERVTGSEVARNLVEDWNLELDAAVDRWDRMAGGRLASPAKLVHNVVLSMPAGTSPQRLLAASRDFAREEFALQHRYALVLHTDQDHPHVHVVVSARKREGGRLNIRKADLRRWREQFARQLLVDAP
jgi:hypothetical protein